MSAPSNSERDAAELFRYVPAGCTVLTAWRSVVQALNGLLESSKYPPLEHRSTYELLSSMKKFPEEQPHELALIEWAFHSSNITWAGEHIKRVKGLWKEETCQSFWNDSFERTCKTVAKVIKTERAKMGITNLSKELRWEYAHWTFVVMEIQAENDKAALEASRTLVDGSVRLALDLFDVAAKYRSGHVKRPDRNAGVLWDGFESFTTDTPSVTPLKIEPGDQLIDTTSEKMAQPSVPIAHKSFFLEKSQEDLCNMKSKEDLYNKKFQEDSNNKKSQENLLIKESQESSFAADSDESDWECVPTPSSSSVYLDDEEYQDIQDPESVDLDTLGNKSKTLNNTNTARKPMVDRRQRKPTISSPLETHPGQTESKGVFMFDEDEIRDNGKLISITDDGDITSLNGNFGDANSAFCSYDSDSEQMACEVDAVGSDHVAVVQQVTAEDKAIHVVEEWGRYWNTYDSQLGRWQKLMSDLGQQGDFSSINKCKMALKPLWINVGQFLGTQRKPQDVTLFRSERELAAYTKVFGGMMSAAAAKQAGNSGPLRIMMAKIKRHFK